MSGSEAQVAYFGVQLLMPGMPAPWRWVDRLGPADLPYEACESFAPVPESERDSLWPRLVAVLESNRDRALAVHDLSQQQWLYAPGALGPFQVVYFE